MFKLRFAVADIPKWSAGYSYDGSGARFLSEVRPAEDGPPSTPARGGVADSFNAAAFLRRATIPDPGLPSFVVSRVLSPASLHDAVLARVRRIRAGAGTSQRTPNSHRGPGSVAVFEGAAAIDPRRRLTGYCPPPHCAVFAVKQWLMMLSRRAE